MDKILITVEERLARIENLLLSQKMVFTFDEVAAYTGLSKSFLYKLTSKSDIPFYRPNGKQLYFNKQEIDSWLLRNRVRTNEEIEQEASTLITLRRGKRYSKVI
ncbi:hypothetical protein AAE02nite_42770 [Adhaeribacter aerolatus]|uniref:Helix-turn-helix domain-containing protein n=1 Tax=Adhaeribacter aerolatus TaxID=670289 RepID=A0A512B3S2_9BACT|nr:helix-turn-helix domain-containing protein [Adhaeribacter aerolatus]GEO06613.1 hypothetical protein AAE02nite_42770 [Adhaeribacter aerolatus]